MGIRFNCPSGHKLNVKEFLAGKRGVCPQCGAKFIIPTPAEAQAAELPLSAGNGLSQSIEIAVAPAPVRPAATASPSPSVIIPVDEIELATPELELPPAILSSQSPVVDAMPTSIVAVQSPIVATPIQAASTAVTPSRRERSRRNQIVISLLLLGLVVVLAGVLIWVLKREMNQTPVEKDEKKAAVSKGEFQQLFAMAGIGSMSSHPRVGALDL